MEDLHEIFTKFKKEFPKMMVDIEVGLPLFQIGMTGCNGSEQVTILLRNGWLPWIGISGQIASE